MQTTLNCDINLAIGVELAYVSSKGQTCLLYTRNSGLGAPQCVLGSIQQKLNSFGSGKIETNIFIAHPIWRQSMSSFWIQTASSLLWTRFEILVFSVDSSLNLNGRESTSHPSLGHASVPPFAVYIDKSRNV